MQSSQDRHMYEPDMRGYIANPTLGHHELNLPVFEPSFLPIVDLVTKRTLVSCLIDELQTHLGEDTLTNWVFNHYSENLWYNDASNVLTHTLVAYYAGLHYIKHLDSNDAIVKASSELAMTVKCRHYSEDPNQHSVDIDPDTLYFYANKYNEIQGLTQYAMTYLNTKEA